MLDSTLYLVMVDNRTGELVGDTSPCDMCRRLIINAGIKQVVIRNDREHYTIMPVQAFIDQDDTVGSDQSGTYGK